MGKTGFVASVAVAVVVTATATGPGFEPAIGGLILRFYMN